MRREKRFRLIWQVGLLLLSLLLISFAVFVLSTYSSGDMSLYILGENARAENHERLSAELGYDRPLILRYIEFLRDFITLNWGATIHGYDLRDLIFSRIFVTLEIMLLTLFLSIPFSYALSCFAAGKRGGLIDRLSRLFIIIFFSMPSFAIAIMLMLIFSFHLSLFPISGFTPLGISISENLSSIFLPSLTLALMHSSLFIRVLKKSLSREMESVYARAARARGKSELEVILHEALKPASFPLIALSSSAAASLFAGSAVVETVFSIPGLGSLAVSASLERDTYTLSIIILLIAFFTFLTSASSRILLSFLDPMKGRAHG